ncbi:hypothetical protein ACF5W4_01055 [Bacillota bacterium Lsc_1132]
MFVSKLHLKGGEIDANTGKKLKEFLLNMLVETIGDMLMEIIAIVIGYYAKIQFI